MISIPETYPILGQSLGLENELGFQDRAERARKTRGMGMEAEVRVHGEKFGALGFNEFINRPKI